MKTIASNSAQGISLHPLFQTPAAAAFFDYLDIPVDFSDEEARDTLRYAKNVISKDGARQLAAVIPHIPDASAVQRLRVSEKRSRQTLRHNVIDISRAFAEEHGLLHNQIVPVLYKDSLHYRECTVSIDDAIADKNEVRVASPSKNHGDLILIIPQRRLCDSVRFQLASVIQDNIITLDAETYALLQELHPDCLSFRHIPTGATMIRPFGEVVPGTNLKKGEIRLNYQQREALNIFDSRKPDLRDNYTATLRDKVTRTLQDDSLYFDDSSGTLCPTDAYNLIQIFPLFDIRGYRYSAGMKISDILAGGCTMRLTAIRPYKIDDARNIVRLSEDTMTLLGIKETDSVIISYLNSSCKAVAMKMDSYDLMKETNIIDSETDLDITIGIPAPLRKQLGIGDIETEVSVIRDTPFIIKKNLNIQMLSVLGLLLAVFQIGSSSQRLLLIKIAVCIVMLPVIIMISLSQERSKVAKPNRRKKRR